MGIFDDMENFLFDRFSVTKRHNVQHRVISISSNDTSPNNHQQHQSPSSNQRYSSEQQAESGLHDGHVQQHPQQQQNNQQSQQQLQRRQAQLNSSHHHQQPQQQQQSLSQHHQPIQHHQQVNTLQQRLHHQQAHEQQDRPQSIQQHSHKQLQRCSSHPQAQSQQFQQHKHPPPVARSHSRQDIADYPKRSSPHSSLPNSPSVPRNGGGHIQMTSARAESSPVSHRRPAQVNHSRIPSSSPFRDRMSWHESRSRPPTGFTELHSPQQEHRGFPSPARSRHRASWVELSNLSGTFDFPTTCSSPHPLRRSASSSSPSSKPGSPTSAAVYNNVNNSNLSRPPSAGPLTSAPSSDREGQQAISSFHNRRTMSSTSLTARSPSSERPPTPSSPYDNNRNGLPPSPSLGVKAPPILDSPTSPQNQNLKNEKCVSVSLPSTFRSEPQLASLDRPACMVAGGGDLPQFGLPTQHTQQANGVVIKKICRPKLVRLRSEPSSPFSSHNGSSSTSSFVAVDPQSPQSAIRCRRRRRDELKRSQSLEVTSSGSCQEELWTGINVPNQLVITRPQLSRADLNRRHLSLHLDCSGGGGHCCAPESFSCNSGDSGSGRAYPPLLFHETHGDNIELLNNKSRARRYESFCKGICFSNRPVHVNETIYVKFVETNTSWSGVLRFGFTSIDPATIQGQELPRYACPDLTNKPGNWAKALGERYTTSNILLHFSVNANGDVTYGVDGEEKGIFFSSVVTTGKLWAMLDVYGNTVTVEFSNAGAAFSDPEPNANFAEAAPIPRSPDDLSFSSLSLDTPGTPPTPTSTFLSGSSTNARPQHLTGGPAIRHHAGVSMSPMPLHTLQGRNIRIIGEERRVAARLESEYCNSLVFSSRPMKFGETFVIQVLKVNRSFVGGLGFGLTACNPSEVEPSALPDDSDYLLDRLEYWVVNKDVCSAPEVGDELSFFLTSEGEVRYSRNGQNQVTLMHVDRTLPLWAFFDIYGNVQRIKILGCTMAPIQYHHLRPSNSITRNAEVDSAGGDSAVLSVAMPASLPPQFLSLRSNSESDSHQTPLKEACIPVQTSSLPPTPSGALDSQVEECHVCYEAQVNCVIYKCGHMCLCYACAVQIKQLKGQCPICRNHIEDIIKVFKS